MSRVGFSLVLLLVGVLLLTSLLIFLKTVVPRCAIDIFDALHADVWLCGAAASAGCHLMTGDVLLMADASDDLLLMAFGLPTFWLPP